MRWQPADADADADADAGGRSLAGAPRARRPPHGSPRGRDEPVRRLLRTSGNDELFLQL